MIGNRYAGTRPCAYVFGRWLRCFAACLLCLVGPDLSGVRPIWAQGVSPQETVVIGNDRGGKIRSQLAKLAVIRANGQKIELRGRVCYSTCTLYLGLPQTCVLPDTRFGFHGPSNYGFHLRTDAFEYWSHLIAAHYPEPLREWYLKTGRARINTFYRISGSELIRMGLAQCAPTPERS
jgi:hypothetical protein